MLFQPEQIQKIASTFLRVRSLAAAGNSTTVTSQITATLGVGGNGGVSVPVQTSTDVNTEGVIAALPTNRALIYDASTRLKLSDSSGKEIFGRITEAAGVYTLSYYTFNAGVETAVSVNQAIDFEFAYRFTFEHLPADFAILVQEREVSEDPALGRFADVWELLNITALNTFDNLTYSPTTATDITIHANGKAEDSFAGGAFAVNTATKALTWNATNAGYSVKTTYRCFAVYKTQL